MRSLILAVAVAALTSSCTTTDPFGGRAVTTSALAAILEKSEPAGSAVTIHAKIVSPSGDREDFPAFVTTRYGQTATMEVIREIIYPTDFDFPKVGAGTASILPITPITPTEFTTKNTGWTLTFTPEKRTGTTLLKGTAEYVTHDRFADAPGEPFSPVVTENNIVITENRARLPLFTTYTTPVLIAASTDNKAYRLPLSHPEPGTYLEVSVSPADTP